MKRERDFRMICGPELHINIYCKSDLIVIFISLISSCTLQLQFQTLPTSVDFFVPVYQLLSSQTKPRRPSNYVQMLPFFLPLLLSGFPILFVEFSLRFYHQTFQGLRLQVSYYNNYCCLCRERKYVNVYIKLNEGFC